LVLHTLVSGTSHTIYWYITHHLVKELFKIQLVIGRIQERNSLLTLI